MSDLSNRLDMVIEDLNRSISMIGPELARAVLIECRTELDRLRARNAKLDRVREAATIYKKLDDLRWETGVTQDVRQAWLDLAAALAACDSEKGP